MKFRGVLTAGDDGFFLDFVDLEEAPKRENQVSTFCGGGKQREMTMLMDE